MILQQGDFYINGKKGKEDLCAILEKMPTITTPKRKKTMTSIEGGNEQIILDEGAYDNREITLTILVQSLDKEDRTMRMSALYSAFDSPDYIGFVYYGEPNYEYQITNADITTPVRPARASHFMEVEIKLSAKPFKIYKPDEELAVSGTITTFNRMPYSSRPLIHFGNSGNSTIRINNTTYYFGPLPTGGAWVDCEESQQDVYNGSTLVDNAFPLAQEFPSIPPGKVTISSTNATVYPRWRTI